MDTIKQPAISNDPKALRILAKSIYRELRGNGYNEGQMVTLAGELLHLVTEEVQQRKNV
jgi:hypothetical protein